MHEFKRKILIQVSILTCIVVIFGTFFVLFRKNIEHQLTQANSLKEKKFIFSQSASGIVKLKKEWEIAQENKVALEMYVPTKDELVIIPQRIKSIANTMGVVVSFVYGQEQDKKKEANIKSIQYTLSVEGPEGSVRTFMTDIDKGFNTLAIDTIDIARISSGIKISATGKVFYR